MTVKGAPSKTGEGKSKASSKSPKNKSDGDKKKNGGKKKKKGSGRYGAMGGYKGVSRKRAARFVDGDIRKLLLQLTHQAQNARAEYRRGKRDVNDLYDRTTGDLGYINAEMQDFLSAMNGKFAGIFDSSNQQLAANQAAQAQGNNEQAAALQAAALAEMQRLGIQGGGDTGAMMGDTQFLNQLSGQELANMQGLNTAQQGAAEMLGQMMQGMAMGSYQSQMGQAANGRNEMLNTLLDAKNDAVRDVRQGKIETLKDRGNAIRQLLEQMNQARFSQWANMQDLNLARARLNLDRRQVNHSIGMDRAGMMGQAAYYGTLANRWENKANRKRKPSSGASPATGGQKKDVPRY